MDGQILKERLSKLTDLTQMELAEKLNVSQQSFSQYFLAKDVKSGLLERLAVSCTISCTGRPFGGQLRGM